MPPSLNTAKLADGNEIFFTDSGPVPNSEDYTTLIILHGSAFHGRGFHKLHGYAEKHNLRTVVCNRKDYYGSTKYTDPELDDLRNGRKIFLDRLGVLVGNFLQYFVEEQKIPKVSEDRKTGGLALVGWSMGTATAMSLFSDPAFLPRDTHTLLEQYVRDIVLYDPPYLSFGYDLPEDHKTYDPWTDPDCKTPEERYATFKAWASSYFDEPEDWAGDINKLDMRKRGDRATVDAWTPKEMEEYYDGLAAVRSELAMYVNPMQGTIKDMVHQVLYNEKIVNSFFPRVRILYVYCQRSAWHGPWGVYNTQQLYYEYNQKGMKIRPTLFIPIKDGNHFAHYDMPEVLLEVIGNGLRS